MRTYIRLLLSDELCGIVPSNERNVSTCISATSHHVVNGCDAWNALNEREREPMDAALTIQVSWTKISSCYLKISSSPTTDLFKEQEIIAERTYPHRKTELWFTFNDTFISHCYKFKEWDDGKIHKHTNSITVSLKRNSGRCRGSWRRGCIVTFLHVLRCFGGSRQRRRSRPLLVRHIIVLLEVRRSGFGRRTRGVFADVGIHPPKRRLYTSKEVEKEMIEDYSFIFERILSRIESAASRSVQGVFYKLIQ